MYFVQTSCNSAKLVSNLIMKKISSAMGLKKGPWLPEEDSKLVASISVHGVGRWNSLALSSDLRRSGKSCRLRWLNYLRPNVRHGGFTLEEQLLILQLHFRWGNRWARIAEQLPGRTDNDIKNYWRTRVVKQAKRLNCDVDSPMFRQAIQHIWIPGISERIKLGSGSSMGEINRIPDDPVESLLSPPLESMGLMQPRNVIIDGLAIGPVGVGPSPSDEQLPESALSDEDIFYLQHLFFDASLNN